MDTPRSKGMATQVVHFVEPVAEQVTQDAIV